MQKKQIASTWAECIIILLSCSFYTQEPVFNDWVKTAHQLMMFTPQLMKQKTQKATSHDNSFLFIYLF